MAIYQLAFPPTQLALRREAKRDTSVQFVIIAVYGVATLLIGLIWFVTIVCAAPLAMFTFLYASHEIMKSIQRLFRVSVAMLLGILAWLSLHLASWRIAVSSAVERYSDLPLDPPQ